MAEGEEDNLTRQADEVEALTSIYGDDWCVVDEASRIYCIAVNPPEHHGAAGKGLRICLQVLLPAEYPSTAPPEYQINAPWLKDAERQEVDRRLDLVCSENAGESVLYLLVEQLREHLTQRPKDPQPDSGTNGDEDETLELALGLESRLVIDAPTTECAIPPIKHGDPITDRRSTFQAHLAYPITSTQQVAHVHRTLLENRKIANATHNVLAYRIYCEDRGSFLQDCDNDGEAAAGPRLLHLLEILDARNVMVVVSRWYGGILLGPDRFKHINNAARNILGANGHIQKDERGAKKKGKHKGK